MPLDDLVTALIFVNRGRSGHPRVGVAKAKGSGIAQMAYCQAVNGEYYSGDYEKMFLRQRSAQKFADELKGRPHSSATRQVPRKYRLCSQKTSKVFGPCGIRVESGVRFAVCNRWQTRIPYSEGTAPKSCVVVPPWC